MKRHLILIGVVLVVLMAAWSAFGQREGRPAERRGGGREGRIFMMLPPEESRELREKWPNMSEEEREKVSAKIREKWQNMSDEERKKLMAQWRERLAFAYRRPGPEDQLKVIEAIQQQLAKLKAAIEARGPSDRSSFRDLSEEERAKLRAKLAKAREEQQKLIKEIIAQVARLRGQGRSAEGEEYIILNTAVLKSIREQAAKEKAQETARLLGRLVGAGGRRPGGRPSGRRSGASDAPPRERRER
jgi:hypothetical protein